MKYCKQQEALEQRDEESCTTEICCTVRVPQQLGGGLKMGDQLAGEMLASL